MTPSPGPQGRGHTYASPGRPRRVSRRARPAAGAAPTEPALPADEQPQLPRRIVRDLERHVGDRERGRKAALALSIGATAIDEGLPDVALRHLEWVKHVAPRSADVREALGVAHYHAGDYRAASRELQAYRRMSGRADQNHVLADALRAQGRDTDGIAALIEEMLTSDVDAARRSEGVIVWASALADAGDLGAARSVLRRFLGSADAPDDAGEAALRLHYVAADLAQRAGDDTEAQRRFEQIAARDGDFHDVAERLARWR